MSEARTGQRFPLELPITIHQKDGDEVGSTANMSAAGVYIMADTEMSVGSAIEFDITLPATVLGTPEDVEVRCTGRVIRSEAAAAANASSSHISKKTGVACVIDQYQFIRKGNE